MRIQEGHQNKYPRSGMSARYNRVSIGRMPTNIVKMSALIVIVMFRMVKMSALLIVIKMVSMEIMFTIIWRMSALLIVIKIVSMEIMFTITWRMSALIRVPKIPNMVSMVRILTNIV